MAFLQAPKNVSPTIKFARWSFLLCGVFYGMNKRTVLETIEKKQHILRQQLIERRKLREEEDTKKVYTEILITFGEMFGMEFPPDWEPPM